LISTSDFLRLGGAIVSGSMASFTTKSSLSWSALLPRRTSTSAWTLACAPCPSRRPTRQLGFRWRDSALMVPLLATAVPFVVFFFGGGMVVFVVPK
jgi:hypothetical protein